VRELCAPRNDTLSPRSVLQRTCDSSTADPAGNNRLLIVLRRSFASSLIICRIERCCRHRFRIGSSVDFQSANPSVIKSVRQRDLLNWWLRLYVLRQIAPRIEDYRPDRLSDELPDLVYYIVEPGNPPRLIIDSNGTRMASAYGATGKGRYLDDYLGSILGPVVLPAYLECIARALPTYTVSMIDDVGGHAVAYERMLLPFSDGNGISRIIASLKTISEDGGFEIKNLMRGHQSIPTPKLCTVIDCNLAHHTPSRMTAGDVIEIG
jgi:hypothetical protein